MQPSSSMSLVFILQELRRRKIAVGIALLLALCAGALLAYRVSLGPPPHVESRQYEVGVASVRVLVDTPHSLVADLNPSGAASLSVHAQLLADLAASEPIRNSVAAKVRIPVRDLAIVPPAISGAPPVPTPVATSTTPPADASTLTLSVDSTLPLVSIAAQAPDQAQAARLADGAVAALRGYLVSVASAQKIPAWRQPVITSLGAVSGTATRGPSRTLAAGAALIVFCVLCYLILLFSGIRQRMASQPSTAEQTVPAQAVAAPASPQSTSPQSNGHHPEPARAFDFPGPELAPRQEPRLASESAPAATDEHPSSRPDGNGTHVPTPARDGKKLAAAVAAGGWRSSALSHPRGRS